MAYRWHVDESLCRGLIPVIPTTQQEPSSENEASFMWDNRRVNTIYNIRSSFCDISGSDEEVVHHTLHTTPDCLNLSQLVSKAVTGRTVDNGRTRNLLRTDTHSSRIITQVRI